VCARRQPVLNQHLLIEARRGMLLGVTYENAD